MQHFHIDKVTYRILRKERTNIDRAMLAVGVLGPIATIPQIIIIYGNKEVAGISILSWLFYLFSNSLALSYGIVHRLRPLMIANSLWIIVDISIIFGCYIYR